MVKVLRYIAFSGSVSHDKALSVLSGKPQIHYVGGNRERIRHMILASLMAAPPSSN